MGEFNLTQFLMYVFAFIIGVTIHEFGHALAADLLGDDTPRVQERLNVNPIDHLDLFGTIFLLATAFLGTPFGWGKPVQTQPHRFKSPRWGSLIVSIAGPSMNIVLAAIIGTVIRFKLFGLQESSIYYLLLCTCVEVNVLLFVFNLIPLPPLDGAKILAAILPENMSRSYERAMAQYGLVLLILLFFGGSILIGPMVHNLTNMLSVPTDPSTVLF